MTQHRAPVVLCLSGGFDSAVLAALHVSERDIWPVFFDYGQSPVNEEMRAALAVTAALALKPLAIRRLPGIPPKGDSDAPYYPYRNLCFAQHAAVYATVLEVSEVWFGFVADSDPGLFPDATGHFCAEFSRALSSIYGDKDLTEIRAPLHELYKHQLVRRIATTDFDTSVTYSCYRGGGRCGTCRACTTLIRAFEEAHGTASESERRSIESINPYTSLLAGRNR